MKTKIIFLLVILQNDIMCELCFQINQKQNKSNLFQRSMLEHCFIHAKSGEDDDDGT